MTKHAELIARLETAEVGSGELGALVECAALAPEGSFVEQSPFNGSWCIYHGARRGRPELWSSRDSGYSRANPSASLDAALALAEKVLPGVDWRLSAGQGWRPMAELWPASERLSILREAIVGQAKSLPLALCIAILKALEDQ